MNMIYCIGDSHTSFFSGSDGIIRKYPFSVEYDIFKAHRIGACTAYGLTKSDSSTDSQGLVKDILEDVPEGSNVLFSFGEIDCRYHILNISKKKGVPYHDIIKDLIDDYVRYICSWKDKYKVGVFAPIASTPKGEEMSTVDCLIFSDMKRRNYITRYFNRVLREECEKNGIIYISIFDDMINKKMETNKKFLMDGLHLNQLLMPKVKSIAMKEFKI